MKQQSIMTLAKDMRFEGYVLVRMSEQRTGNTGNKYLDLTLADCTGELNGKLWDGNTDPPPVGSVIKVRGMTLEYNGRLQLRIEKMRPLEDNDKVDMSLLTPSAPESPTLCCRSSKKPLQASKARPCAQSSREWWICTAIESPISPRRSASTTRNAAAFYTIRWACCGLQKPCCRYIRNSTKIC